MKYNFKQRPRRNRKSEAIRKLNAETKISRSDFIFPLFVVDGKNKIQEIKSLPGQYRYSTDELLKVCEKASKMGVSGVALFPALEESLKDSKATLALDPNNLVSRTISLIKNHFPELLIVSDLALDPFSDQGHDGLVVEGEIINDATVDILSQMAVLHAEAGVDIVAPSDMMDGRVREIRKKLDVSGFENTNIMAYSAKYASAFYGPFREALDSAPRFGDKKTYQLSPRNRREALIETRLDEEEGADILMIKPALPYLDIIREVRNSTQLPVAAYNVSGEYAMIKAAAQKGWIDEKNSIGEALVSIKRAGADIIITYFALDEYEIGY